MSDCIGKHEDAQEAATVGYLCARCFSRLRRSVLELPAIAAWLHVNLAAGGVAGERVGGTKEDPIPLRLDVLDLIGPVAPDPSAALFRDMEHQHGDPSMYDEMRSWAALVEEESGFEWDDRATLVGAVSYLAGHLSWIVAQPWVDEFADKVSDLSRRAHRIAPWRAEVIRDKRPCETCGVAAICNRMAEGRSVCEKRLGGCGRTIVWDHERKTA